MTLDVELQSMVRESEGDLLAFARKLYEHGYRQGLASRPASQVELAAVPAPVVATSVLPATGPLFPSPARSIPEPDVDSGDSQEDEVADDQEPTSCDHRVRGSISVAGLQKKIERIFDLSRFDIEVVICRRGDSERRRLKSSVKLKNYLLEGE